MNRWKGLVVRFRLVLVAMVALAALAPAAAQAGESDQFSAHVTFRLTLEGPVEADDTFAVRVQCRKEICVTPGHNAPTLCGPPHPDGAWELCAAGTYEFEIHVRPGLTVDYALRRYPNPAPGTDPEEHLEGSWVAVEGEQVISLGYNYSSGAPAPAAPTPAPTAEAALPNTALPAP